MGKRHGSFSLNGHIIRHHTHSVHSTQHLVRRLSARLAVHVKHTAPDSGHPLTIHLFVASFYFRLSSNLLLSVRIWVLYVAPGPDSCLAFWICGLSGKPKIHQTNLRGSDIQALSPPPGAWFPANSSLSPIPAGVFDCYYGFAAAHKGVCLYAAEPMGPMEDQMDLRASRFILHNDCRHSDTTELLHSHSKKGNSYSPILALSSETKDWTVLFYGYL